MQNVHEASSVSQESHAPSDLPGAAIDSLVTDLRELRDRLVAKDRRRRSAILVGQLALLAREYRDGNRPNRRTLKRFFHFVAREQAPA
jgi:hypothetical protein